MDVPIISIYDMLMKRHRQPRKVDNQQQKERRDEPPKLVTATATAAAAAAAVAAASAEPKKLRSRKSRTKLLTEMKAPPPVSNSSSLVTAKHLTQKVQGIVLPPPTEKAVLSHLVEKMAGGRGDHSQQKAGEKPVEPLPEPVEQPPTVRVSSGRKRAVARAKAKYVNDAKTACSGWDGVRGQLVLSPRNANQLEPHTTKSGRLAKAKVTALPDSKMGAPNTPDRMRTKQRLRKWPSEGSVKWDGNEANMSQLADGALRYRL